MSPSETGLSHPSDTVGEDTLDTLVSKASAPSLATLFRKAKAKGLITSITHYGPNKEVKAPPEGPKVPQSGATYNPLGASTFSTSTNAQP